MKPIEETHPSLIREYPKINERTYDNANYSARDIQKHTVDKQVLKETYERMCRQRIAEGYTCEDAVVSGDELFEEMGLDE